jgi:hypothetical protein
LIFLPGAPGSRFAPGTFAFSNAIFPLPHFSTFYTFTPRGPQPLDSAPSSLRSPGRGYSGSPVKRAIRAKSLSRVNKLARCPSAIAAMSASVVVRLTPLAPQPENRRRFSAGPETTGLEHLPSPSLNFNLQIRSSDPGCTFGTRNLQTDHAMSMVILSESASRRNFLFNVLRLRSNDGEIST